MRNSFGLKFVTKEELERALLDVPAGSRILVNGVENLLYQDALDQDLGYIDFNNNAAVTRLCAHDHLNESGYCRRCGEDRRGA